jgi:hypothetical protein
MTPDDNDKLWNLLGQARPPEVSPFFARNVLRAVRQEEATRPRGTFFARLAQTLRPLCHKALPSALTATCAVAILLTISPGLLSRHHRAPDVQAEGVAKQIVGNPDYEVINHLDELVADEESSLWLDDNTRDPK